MSKAHAILKSKNEEAQAQLLGSREAEEEWRNKHSTLTEEHAALLEKLAKEVEERDTLSKEKENLQSNAAASKNSIAELQAKLAHVSSELTTSARNLETLQTDLKSANRRAVEAERTQGDLQAEGTNLMRSLDEMRPKIVELTSIKAELGEKLDSLEHALRSRDVLIAQQEATLQEVHDQNEEVLSQLESKLAAMSKELSTTQNELTELTTAYGELKTELETSRTNVLALEAERVNNHQDASRRFEEVDRLQTASRLQADELTAVKRELEENKRAQGEEQAFLERARTEIESLRSDVLSRDEEIQRLQGLTTHQSDHSTQSLDHEMLSSLKQQHALDLSTAQSKIRALESSVFEAEAKAHSLQKHVSSLEGQLAQLRSSQRVLHRPHSPSVPSRPSSRTQNHMDLRRASLTMHRPIHPTPPPLSRSVFDQNMSSETRHKRQVSLSMLKARMDSELATAPASARPPSRALSPIHSLPTVVEPISEPNTPPLNGFHRPQFMDESHVFWCNSCRGDLVIL